MSLEWVKRIYDIYSLSTPPHCDVSKGSQCFFPGMDRRLLQKEKIF